MGRYYDENTAASWTALSTAMSAFATGMGTYTEQFGPVGANPGLTGMTTTYPGVNTVLCLKHAASEMFYMWDSGPSDSLTSFGLYGNAGESFIYGIMCEYDSSDGVTPPAPTTPFGQHSGIPYVSPLSEAILCPGWQTKLPMCTRVVFSENIPYKFFGGDGLGGDDDYFHMVLEIQTGVFSHWWSGQIAPTTSLLPGAGNRFGGFMGCGGPWGYSLTDDRVVPPFLPRMLDKYPSGLIFFPEKNGPDPSNPGSILSVAGAFDIGAGVSGGFSVRKSAHTIGYLPDLDYNWTQHGNGVSWKRMWDPGYGGQGLYAGHHTVTGRTLMGPNIAILGNAKVADAGAWSSYADYALGARLSILGSIPGVNPISLEALEAGDTITVSTDTYDVYPLVRKSGAGPDGVFPTVYASSGHTGRSTSATSVATGMATGYEGYAYLKPTA